MTVSMPISARGILVMVMMMCLAQGVPAHRSVPAPPLKSSAGAGGDAPTLSVVEWLQRMHQASRQRSYIGTFVVSSAGGNLSSARIWHVSEGDQQMERIEALSGPPRSTFRRNDHVVTFLPELKLVKVENRENLELFPNLQGAADSSIDDFYGVRVIGKDRVAGFDTDVVQLEPQDALRFGYRVWSERRSGLMVKLQTLDGDGKVIEQSAFSELELDAPVKVHSLVQKMDSTAGYRVQKSELEHTTAQREGWALKAPVAGFRPVSSLRRPMDGQGEGHAMQWTFSDGLASVSLFIEPYDASRKPREVLLALGATYTLTRRMTDKDGVDWWLTAVGEVPPQTLDAFAQSLVRTN
jgi:sigma-E factor negative regulatory protein RseB